MKSFAGIVHRDGTSPDARLLQRMASALRLSASSEPAIAIDGACGLAGVSHRGGAARITQNGDVTVAGDMSVADDTVLRAWRQSREECAARLSGDFSFALWDRAASTLFCARDRFGVRPFFYAPIPRGLVFAGSLAAVLAHPDVAIDFDEATVADYLTGGVTDDAQSTIYAHVRRLPPAHTMTFRGEPVLRRYWIPRAPTRRDGSPAELESALKAAIAERVDTPSAIVFMSGGLDSTALAALTREAAPQTRLLAMTSVYRTRIADVEEPFAVEAARSIGIPIRCVPLDHYAPLQAVDESAWTADPGALLSAPMTRDLYALAAGHAPLALHGHPADAVLAANIATFVRSLSPSRRVTALVRYTRLKRRPPYFFIRDLLGFPRRVRNESAPPDWLLATPRAPRAEDPASDALRALASPEWSSYFEWAHPLSTGAALELVYPWCDERVIEAALALEPIPWLVDKHVLREILRGRVSERIRRRPKSYLQGDPWACSLNQRDVVIDAASRFIDPGRFMEACRTAGSLRDSTLRAVAFEYWLRALPSRVAGLRTGSAVP
jgi:asparagine synthase (glutamine-hydrolysing)